MLLLSWACVLSPVRLFEILWTVACQAPLSMGCSRQEYWSGLPFPVPGDLPDPGSILHLLCLLHWQAHSVPLSHLGSPSRFIPAKELKIGIEINVCT